MNTITKNKVIYWILAIVIAVLAICSAYLFSREKALANTVENNYNRAFHELVGYVDDINTLLQKSMLVSSASQMSSLSSELFRQSAAAKACLGQLPVSEIQLESTEKFLSQVGDFTYMLSQNVINQNEITDENYQNLNDLGKYAASLNDKLLKMQQDIYNGDISFGTMKRTADKYITESAEASGNDILGEFESVEKEFQEYPSLIYDGPFSEHIKNIKPAMLEGEKELSKEDALKKAKKFLDEKGDNLEYSGKTTNTLIESYSYSSSADNKNVYINVSKKGGHIIYFLDTRDVNDENYDFADAIAFAKDFLNKKGYTQLKESYYDKSNGVATINFAYVQGDVVCYSDLIKVKVALDNGEILGMEANGYVMNHKHRDLETPALSENKAKSLINKHLSVTASKKALIPKDSKKEILCYEFKGEHNGRNFLIYINAKTGVEEEILMLIESDEGILTI